MSFPLKVKELLQLTDYGVPKDLIQDTTMQSEKFIVCRGKAGNSSQVTIIDLDDPLNPERKPISVGSVIMHPTQRIIACRNASVLGIFDVEKEIKLKEHKHNGKIVFWKWLDEETIGFCTLGYAYTWTLTGNSPPVRMFKLLETLAPHAIVDYAMNYDRTWHAIVTGPRPNVTKEVGIMQLYSATSGISKQLDGYAACFCSSSAVNSTLLVHCTKSKTYPANKGMLCLKALSYESRPALVDEPFIFEFEDDFPTYVQVSLTFGVIFLVTNRGFVHLFDLKTRVRLYSIRFSQIPLFAVTSYENGGIIGINEKGQVLSVTINQGTMLKYIGKTNPALVSKLYKRWSTIPESPKKSIPRKKPPRVTQQPVVPSAPSLALYDEPPVTTAAPVTPTAPVFPSAPIASSAPLTIPPSQIHLYAMPPPYSPRDEANPVVATPTDAERRALAAERERDELARRYAELEAKYRQAMTLNERRGQTPAAEPQNGLYRL